MSWSSTAPTLPSGSSWGTAVTKTETGSNYSARQTARAARGLGNTYYIELSVYYDLGQDLSNFYPSDPTYFVANGESISVGRPSRYQTITRYYTGSSSSSASVRVGES
ncbi:MAG: hypothetical protein IJU18_00205, partial [Oscillospiraceae bacterium]|nr:hypothetical protein [Oscillospiraceae bacterium]